MDEIIVEINDDIQKYIRCMQEIKLRFEVINSLLSDKLTTGQPMIDIELVCLQFRCVIELIALSSLSAHRNEYERIRSQFSTDWHAKKIFAQIEDINPRFYPVPTERVDYIVAGTVVPPPPVKQSGFLTRDEAIEAWDLCSNYVHAQNPYNPHFDPEEVKGRFKTWFEKVITLLSFHRIQLLDPKRQLWVDMQSKINDGKIVVHEMGRN